MRVLGLLLSTAPPPPPAMLPALVLALPPAELPCEVGEKGSVEKVPCCPLRGLLIEGLMRAPLGVLVAPVAAEDGVPKWMGDQTCRAEHQWNATHGEEFDRRQPLRDKVQPRSTHGRCVRISTYLHAC
jgi:hypothetical protein